MTFFLALEALVRAQEDKQHSFLAQLVKCGFLFREPALCCTIFMGLGKSASFHCLMTAYGLYMINMKHASLHAVKVSCSAGFCDRYIRMCC